jgi:hypothetical protein
MARFVKFFLDAEAAEPVWVNPLLAISITEAGEYENSLLSCIEFNEGKQIVVVGSVEQVVKELNGALSHT